MNTTIKLLLGLTLVLAFSRLNAQNKDTETVQKLSDYSNTHPQEKLFIHFDKPFYSLTDIIWFKVYLVDAVFHIPRKETLVYVELLNEKNEIVASRNIQILDGGGFGDFDLKELRLEPAKYVVRAYTNFMRNYSAEYFFYEELTIGKLNQDVTVDENRKLTCKFFPEGGELVAGELNYVAFKINASNENVDGLEGVIVDQNGKEITKLKIVHEGMGKFPIMPEIGSSLSAKFDLRGKKYSFPLPSPLEKGFVLSARNTGSNLVVIAKHTDPVLMNGAYIVMHQRGAFLGVVKAGDKPVIQNAFKASTLPAGIISFTLFDKDGLPQRERIAFIENKSQSLSKLNHSLDKEEYKKREKVTLSINQLLDSAQFTGNASVSITNVDLIPLDSRESTLLSYLLLSSDIKGNIENPSYYFDEENKDRLKHLDLLMLTQGWRKFTWKEILADETPEFNYLLEKGITIEGQLTKFYNREKKEQGEVTFSLAESILSTQKVISNEDGYFYIPNIMFGDTATVILQAKKEDKKKKGNDDYFIEVLDKEPVVAGVPDMVRQEKTIKINDTYLNASNKIAQIDSAFKLEEGVLLLGEFEIRADKDITDSPFYQAESTYGTPSKRIVADSVPGIVPTGRVLDLLRNTAGVQVRGSSPNQTLVIRGNNSFSSGSTPLILLDGIFTDLSTLNNLFTSEIDYIDILRGGDAVYYGANGANGVVAVYTKRGSGKYVETPSVGIVNFRMPGFTVAREFYAPDYSEIKDTHRKPDFRTTLYWNPNINLTESSKLDFFTSDENGNYHIHIEGITSEGKIIIEDASFIVK